MFESHADSVERFHAGRKALVLGKASGGKDSDLFEIRWPNGQETMAFAGSLKGPVEPAKPGVDEPCVQCGGSGTVNLYEPDAKREWIQNKVAVAACPNCGEDS